MTDFAIATSRFASMTEAEALASEWDEDPTLTSHRKTLDYCQLLESRRRPLEQLISRHLGIAPSDFELHGHQHWIWGSFNICLPIDISHAAARDHALPKEAILRLPLPWRSGEDFDPGNGDEKLRCEAATYIWLRRQCPSIPTPRLLGMGFPGGQSFTCLENETRWNRVLWHLRRGWAWLHGATLSPYFAHYRAENLSDLGYLLLEHVPEGRPLSSTWKEHRHDENRRIALYRGLSNVLVELPRVPLLRAGSWTIDGRGVISLTNRPLVTLTMLWGRHGIPTKIPRDRNYASAQPFILDLLAYHDIRMRHQLNSILSMPDGVYQLSALGGLRALLPNFWAQSSQKFVLVLSDLHQSNIIVDDDWNITGLIDFEFASDQPAEMVHVPTWLSYHDLEDMRGPALDEYRARYDQFVDILEAVEANKQQGNVLSQQLKEDLKTGKIWYNAALLGTNFFPFLYERNLCPRFFEQYKYDTDGVPLMRLWAEDCEELIAAELEDNKDYDRRIRDIFAAARAEELGDQSKELGDQSKEPSPG